MEFLSFDDFQSIQKLTAESSEEALQDAISEIYPHLGDCFLELGSLITDTAFGPKFLRVFPAVEDPTVWLFLLVGHDGQLRLGRTDQLKSSEIKREKLPNFQDEHHQILSVNVSNTRFDSDGADIWIVIREIESETSVRHVYYRGIAGLEGDSLFLEPAPHRGNEKAKWITKPVPIQKSPWLIRWNFEANFDSHPFRCLDDTTYDWLMKLDEENHHTLEKVRVHPNVISLVFADRIEFFSNIGNVHLYQKDYPATIENHALWESQDTNELHLVAGCSDRTIMFSVHQSRLDDNQNWHSKSKECKEVACELAPIFIGDNNHPNLLVAFLDGRLLMLQPIEETALDRLESVLWQHLNLSQASQKQELIKQITEVKAFKSAWRKAALGAWVKQLTGHEFVSQQFPDLTENQKESLKLALIRCFTNPNEDFSVFDEGLRYLRRSLVEVVTETYPAQENRSNYAKFLSETCLGIYDHAILEVQDTFDRLFRTLEQQGKIKQKQYMETFIDYAKQSCFYLTHRGARSEKNDDDVYQSILRIEGWSNVYWEEDYLRLEFFRKINLVDVATLEVNGKLISLFASRRLLKLCPLEEIPIPVKNGTEKLEDFIATCIGQSNELEDGPWQHEDIVCLCNLPGESEKLLIATASGKIYLCHISWGQSGYILDIVNSLASPDLGSTRCLVASQVGKNYRIAAVYNKGSQSYFVTTILKHSTFAKPDIEYLPMPRARLICIAKRGKGRFLVLKAGRSSTTPKFFEIDEQGKLQSPFYGHEIHSGVRTLCFDDPENAQYALVGERNGNLWCHRLSGSKKAFVDYCWSHHFKSSLSSSIALKYQDESHFLIGTKNGDLTLLRARDGKRVWKHRFRRSIEKILPLDPDAERILVVMKGGWIALHCQIPNRQNFYKELEKDLAFYEENAWGTKRLIWRKAGNAVHAIYALKTKQWNVEQTFKTNNNRTSRVRILRYLVEKEQGLTQQVLKNLNFRDFAIYLSYLEDNRQFQDLVWTAIQAKISEIDDSCLAEEGDDSKKSRMAAVATYLQSFSKRQASLEDVYGLNVPNRVLNPEGWLPNSNWVTPVFVRLVLEAVSREPQVIDPEEASHFLKIVPVLLRFPPSLLRTFQDAFPHRSELQKKTRAFRQLLEGLVESDAQPERESVERWEPFSTMPVMPMRFVGDVGRLLPALGGLFCCEFSEQEWVDERSSILENLQKLHANVHELQRLKHSSKTQLSGLIVILFPENRWPDDTVTLEKQVAWFRSWRDKFLAQLDIKLDHSDLWLPYWKIVYNHLKNKLRLVLDRVIADLAKQVRPKLSLSKPQYGASRRITLKLTASPDGLGEAEDVTIVYNADVEGGLIPLGELSTYQQNLERYPGKFSHHVFELSGLLPLKQQDVKVVVDFNSEKLKSKVVWTLKLPVLRSVESDLSIVEDLPTGCKRLTDELGKVSSKVQVIVCDEKLGQQDFARFIVQQEIAQPISVDGVLEEYGRGRKYSHQSLDARLIMESIARQTEHQADLNPTLLYPIDQSLIRLQAASEHGLNDLLQALEEYFKNGRGPLWLVINSSNARALLGSRRPVFPVVWIHAKFQAYLLKDGTKNNPVFEELEKLATRLLPKHPSKQLPKCFQHLGWDIRFIFSWFQWLKNQTGKQDLLLSVEEFLKSKKQKETLRHELATLEGKALIIAMLGAKAVSRVPMGQVCPGHVIAEAMLTTTKKSSTAQKVAVVAGEELDRVSLQNLSSDLAKHKHLKLEGLGSGSYLEPISTFFKMSELFDKPTKVSIYHQLRNRGIGQWLKGHYRTYSHFKTLIKDLYSRVSHENANTHDGFVFNKIKMGLQTPLESLSLENIASLKGTLGELIPGNGASFRAEAALNLAKLWLSEEPPNREACRHGLLPFFPNLVLPENHVDYANYLEPFLAPRSMMFCLDSQSPVSGFLLWIFEAEKNLKETLHALAEQLERARLEYLEREKLTQEKHWKPLLIVVGPGAENETVDHKRRMSFMRRRDFLRAVWLGDHQKEILRIAQKQHSLLHRSPYQTVTALPANSPVFFGREDELEYIKGRIRKGSILIVGSRRVGKTSLLNQVVSWARKEPDLVPIYLDLQGDKKRSSFYNKLRLELEATQWEAVPHHNLYLFTEAILKKDKLPVFLINEVDDLAKHDREFLYTWRQLNDHNKARFVMVGYNTWRFLGAANSPLFHFTQGNAYENKAISLNQLSETSARRIPDQLEGSRLGLRWESPEQKEEIYRLLLDRSYRIPWVLQSYCQKLVEYLNQNRLDTIDHKMVVNLVTQEGADSLVWHYIENLDYQEFQADDVKDQAFPYAIKLLLYAVVRERYLLGGTMAPIFDPKLSKRSHQDKPFGFTPSEAYWAMENAMSKILVTNEKTAVFQYFKKMDIKKSLSMMTLTLLVEPTPGDSEQFGFLLHILPKELHRKFSQKDPTLDNKILNLAIDLVRHIQ